LNKKDYKTAIEIFRMNVESFPDSWNAYDSLGEAYLSKGDKEKAIVNYKKSIELNPDNENGKKILKEIQS
jgi:tetratricopeptide (TPR) repeat protein